MQIKIGNKIFDANNGPIMLEFDGNEKQQVIDAMNATTENRICFYPDSWSRSDIQNWLKFVGELAK